MKTVKMSIDNKKANFGQVKTMADERAKTDLGECFNISWVNGETKLVSPTLVACSIGSTEDCGAESYAKSFEADLEISVNNLHKFYYRKTPDYIG